ncbi:metal ABC transporter substrate-binding protein [Haloferula chungangensis]|uniref:Metal ABC transporter substrate-binding protein n=1 Tax=Haloferula chungangensis TaxID=1048331 RepID=A0ABW2L6F0_9BACT
MRHWISFLILLLAGSLSAKELQVATLHPLLGDLARQVGGDRVHVVDLLDKTSDPHHFEPTPDQLRQSSGTDLFLASGMGLESYLSSLKTIIQPPSQLIVLGDGLPSIEGACNDPTHNHAQHDHAHELDPHWWHSIDTFRRASTLTAAAFAKADPAGAEVYQANALAYRAKLDELERWTRRTLARIPQDRRILATAHAAFGYFCRDYGFEPLPISGINREQMPDARTLANLIKDLKSKKVPVIFPEAASNPKTLAALTEETGIRLAPPLNADGSTADTYEEMMRKNVGIIAEALK